MATTPVAASVAFTASANLSITGVTPDTGPKPVVTATASFTSGATTVGDYISDTFVVNANTPATALDLGKISAGKIVWLETNGLAQVTITQDLGSGPEDVTMNVEKLLVLQSGFTALKVANPSLTTAVRISVTVAGDRPAIGAGPGVF